MSKTIQVRMTKPKDQAMEEVRRALADIGVDCEFTKDGGSFSGNGFAGEIRIVGDMATVEVRE